MHSTIFQLTDDIEVHEDEEQWVDESYFYDNFVGSVAECVDNCDEKERKDKISRLIDFLVSGGYKRDFVVFNEEQESITFKKGYAKEYFEKKFEDFKKAVAEMSLDDFLDSGSTYDLSELLNDERSFYIYEKDKSYDTLDEFVRSLPDEDVAYYICSAIDYHF